MLRITLFFALAAAAAVALVAAWNLDLKPSGSHTTQTRTVGTFDRIDVRGSMDVHVRPGHSPTLTVSGPRHRVDDVIAHVQDGTLVVGQRDTAAHWVGWGDDTIVVIVRAPRVDAVTLDGSGHVSLPPVHGGTAHVKINGSGAVAASGRVDRLVAAVNGSGNAHLAGLSARRATVAIAGSGEVDVDARQSLAATVHGDGDVHYTGRPSVTREVDGSGSVSAS